MIEFVLGAAVGGLFRLCGLQMISPPNFAGIMGIIGLTVGWLLVDYFK